MRSTIAEIRAIVSGLTGDTPSLAEALADMRYEAGQRLEAAGIALQWHEHTLSELALDYRTAKNLSSVLRETLSNIVRHAQAARVRIDVRMEGGALHMQIGDDGKGLDGTAPGGGHGLKNIQRRMVDIGGQADAHSSTAGTTIQISVPLATATDATMRPSRTLA